jgi:CpeT protein
MNKVILSGTVLALWLVVASFNPPAEPPFALLKHYMSGSFSSELQSKNDSDYFDIRLRMEPIWKATDSEFYLYVEQAMSSSLEKPYRQRIYRVVKDSDSQFTSYIYTVNAPARFTGKKGDDVVFSSITPDSLKVLEGCEVRLQFNQSNQTFEGATGDRTCPSTRSGATFTTSKVMIGPNGMVSWDQGWNDAGAQVWGATKGGYDFIKQ